jgi:hypothetical protein
MQTAMKDNEPDASPRKWRQRKLENARRRQEIERRKQLVDGYVQALGGADRISPLQLEDVYRCVDLILLARTARADLLAGKARINDVVKLENAVGRAMLRLNPSPGRAAPADEAWRKFLADHHPASEEEEE